MFTLNYLLQSLFFFQLQNAAIAEDNDFIREYLANQQAIYQVQREAKKKVEGKNAFAFFFIGYANDVLVLHITCFRNGSMNENVFPVYNFSIHTCFIMCAEEIRRESETGSEASQEETDSSEIGSPPAGRSPKGHRGGSRRHLRRDSSGPQARVDVSSSSRREPEGSHRKTRLSSMDGSGIYCDESACAPNQAK